MAIIALYCFFLSLSRSFVRSLLSHSNIEKTKELYVYRRGGRRHHYCSHSNIEKTKELYVYRRGGRRHHYCIVEEKRRRRKGGRHVVLYAFSHRSFSLECRFVLLSFTRQKKFDILYENYMMVHHR